MRISDWSSDVCSSDLEQQRHHHKEFHQCTLARAGLSRQQLRMHMMATADPAEVVELAERQQHGRDTSEQHQQAQRAPDRKRAVQGKSVTVSVALGGRRTIKKKKNYKTKVNITT